MSQIIESLADLVATAELVPHLRQTGLAVLLSFLGAVGLGIPVGTLLGSNRYLKSVLDPFLVAWYAVPFFALYPVLVTILGFGLAPIVTTATIGGLVGVCINTALGIDRSIEGYRRVVRSFRINKVSAYRKVYLPAAASEIFSGVRIGFVYCYLGVIAVEFILSGLGLGYLVKSGYEVFDVRTMWAGTFAVLLIGTIIVVILDQTEQILFHRLSGSGGAR